MQKIRVGVLMGGKSIEREVSFNSGRTVCDHLDTSRYEIIPIFQTLEGHLFILPLHFLYRGKISDFQHRLSKEAQKIIWDKLPELIDFVYICTHGNWAEDGTLQGFLEVLGIPYLGSKILGSAFSMNKIMQKEILRAHNIEVARDCVLTPKHIESLDESTILEQLAQKNITFPCIVKPYKEGSSLGVRVVTHPQELLPAVHHACTINPQTKQAVLIEEKIEGMEFSCITITDYKTNTLISLPPTEIVIEKNTHIFDYEQKYMPGRATKFTPARCSDDLIKKIQDTCVQTTRALGLTNISRIDGFVTPDEHVFIIDPNALSGMGPASFVFREAAEINMSHTKLINHLIETELHAYGMLDKFIHQEKLETKTMNTRKLRVAVLMGGDSNEREISLESGRNVTYKLSPYKYEVLPIFVNSYMHLFHINQSLLVRNSTKEIDAIVTPAMQITWHDLPQLADFVFIALHGGKGENGAVQGTLEMLGIPYNGSSVLTSALCMDKYKTTQFLRTQNFDVPHAYLIDKDVWQHKKEQLVQHIEENIAFPCIVKPHDDGCSVLVEKITNIHQLIQKIEYLFTQNKSAALVEEFIRGMELTVGVIGNEAPHALPPSQTVTTHDILSMHEKFLPGAGENQTPAPLPPSALMLVQKTMERAYAALQCKGYARIDCFYQSAQQSPTGQERVVILEVNTLPALTPATCIFHQALEVGIKPMDFIDQIVQFGLEEHRAHHISSSQLPTQISD
ncbi:MAG TPA: ATP-grasp domain-containing protein [Candidatus Dependentiae bacterium]|nr:ATP-grasp domain-containing protein [Candidatus Dependentiae bacterium]HRQ63052.1 ATP-grasp domain-containing protein [Candidatus Dependentiae bacterium]